MAATDSGSGKRPDAPDRQRGGLERTERGQPQCPGAAIRPWRHRLRRRLVEPHPGRGQPCHHNAGGGIVLRGDTAAGARAGGRTTGSSSGTRSRGIAGAFGRASPTTSAWPGTPSATTPKPTSSRTSRARRNPRALRAAAPPSSGSWGPSGRPGGAGPPRRLRERGPRGRPLAFRWDLGGADGEGPTVTHVFEPPVLSGLRHGDRRRALRPGLPRPGGGGPGKEEVGTEGKAALWGFTSRGTGTAGGHLLRR